MKFKNEIVNFEKEEGNFIPLKVDQIPKVSCIYCWTNINNGKRYIGQTRNLNRRCKDHIYRKEENKNLIPYFYNAMAKEGVNSFILSILEVVGDGQLDEKEKFYINLYDTTNREKGYNLTGGGSPFNENFNKGRISLSNGITTRNVFFEEAKLLLKTKKWGYGRRDPYYPTDEELNNLTEETLKEIKKKKEKIYKEDRLQEARKYSKRYWQENRERLREYSREYEKAHREENNLKLKKDKEANPQKYKELNREHYLKYRDKILAHKKDLAKNFPDLAYASNRRYYKNHREEILKRDKERKLLKRAKTASPFQNIQENTMKEE